MKMKNLPIGVQTFSDFKKNNLVYVDKTELIYNLVTTGYAYFLSRPRRFGKSLLCSTMKELFLGNKDLFEGLWIEDKWDWTQTNPVIHLSFTSIAYREMGLGQAISYELKNIASKYDLTYSSENYSTQFKELIEQLSKKHGRVVLIIDEYDKPIIDFLEKEKIPQAEANRDILKTFYSVLKDASMHLRLLFITGVSKFSKVSIFSDLNHLDDLTLDENYATLTGYTQTELEFYFEDYIQSVMERHQLTRPVLLEMMRENYNGFSWDGPHTVYNPFGTLNFFKKRAFEGFWFASGTPTFLVNLMKKQVKFNYENTQTTTGLLDKYDLNNLDIVAILFQTGYLTIKKRDFLTGELLLDYPNKEIKSGMYEFMINAVIPSSEKEASSISVKNLAHAFQTNDLEQVKRIINTLFSDLPSNLYERDDNDKLKEMQLSERFFHGTIHLIFKYLGLHIDSEVWSSQGRADSVVQTATHVYVFEFKYNRSGKAAMTQLLKNNYADKYRTDGKIIVGVGVNFSHKTRRLNGWEVKQL
jgi:hypothetical protein